MQQVTRLQGAGWKVQPVLLCEVPFGVSYTPISQRVGLSARQQGDVRGIVMTVCGSGYLFGECLPEMKPPCPTVLGKCG